MLIGCCAWGCPIGQPLICFLRWCETEETQVTKEKIVSTVVRNLVLVSGSQWSLLYATTPHTRTQTAKAHQQKKVATQRLLPFALHLVLVGVSALGAEIAVVSLQHLAIDLIIARDIEILTTLHARHYLLGKLARHSKVRSTVIERRSLDSAWGNVEYAILRATLLQLYI